MPRLFDRFNQTSKASSLSFCLFSHSSQFIFTPSTALMPTHYRPPPPKSASKASQSTLCQKCLKRDTSNHPLQVCHLTVIHDTTATNALLVPRTGHTRPVHLERSSCSTRSSFRSSPTTTSTSARVLSTRHKVANHQQGMPRRTSTWKTQPRNPVAANTPSTTTRSRPAARSAQNQQNPPTPRPQSRQSPRPSHDPDHHTRAAPPTHT
jgi:hypothetical protein